MSRSHNNYEARILRLTLLAGLPAVVVALGPLWLGPHAPKVKWTLSLIVLGAWLGLSLHVRELVIRPLQTLANLLAAIREGDFSIRGRPTDRQDALGAAMAEVNALGATLRAQRLGAIEASALLDKVMAEIDVAVFAFDGERRLALVNPAGARLLPEPGPPERLVGRSAAELGLSALLAGEAPHRADGILRGAAGPWELRRTTFRLGGQEHSLVVLTDLQRVLREEERQAWVRLVRVLGHEINNSLAPIQSIAGNLAAQLARRDRPLDLDEDLARGLAVIERRAASLARFMNAYARLARLPPPRLAVVSVPAWVQRVAELEKRLPIEVLPGPDVTVRGDPDQLDQLLINLLRNAVDAALETGGAVQLRWQAGPERVEVSVLDEGPGLAETGNLFVPFFTTKPGGSGIGLVLSRQIAEAHAGSLTLVNRDPERPGCEARLTLPRPRSEPEGMRGTP